MCLKLTKILETLLRRCLFSENRQTKEQIQSQIRTNVNAINMLFRLTVPTSLLLKFLKHIKLEDGPFLWTDEWITCNLMSVVFQSYQDDGRMIMKDWVQWNPVYD